MTNLSNIVEVLAQQALGGNQQASGQGGLGGILGSVLGQMGGQYFFWRTRWSWRSTRFCIRSSDWK